MNFGCLAEGRPGLLRTGTALQAAWSLFDYRSLVIVTSRHLFQFLPCDGES